MRGIAVAMLATAAVAAGINDIGRAQAHGLEVESLPRRLNMEDEAQREVGRLRWRGGLELRAADEDFGGFSGLYLHGDNGFTAVTDKGRWLTGRLVYDAAGDLAGIDEAAMGRLRDPAGRPLEGKRDQDAEALALLEDGSVLVAFEHRHRIWRYPAGRRALAGTPRALPPPPGFAALPGHDGVEALVALADGRVLALGDFAGSGGDLGGFLWDGEAWADLAYRTSAGFVPAGAALLPSGDVVVVERRFTPLGGLTIRLRRVAQGDIAPGAVLAGEELALLAPPLTVDNMEGIDARLGRDGETLLILISDDNFHFLQRTLLLMFEVLEERS